VVDAIAADLVTHPRRDPFAVALFAYRARALGDESVLLDRYLGEITDAAETTPLPLSLFGGVVGVGWLRAHFELDDESDVDLEDQLAESIRTGWAGDYDLIAGLVGVGVYALERRAHGSRSDLLDAIVDRLTACAQPDGDGVSWWTHPQFLASDVRRDYPTGWCNLGVAHGVPGAIAFLGAAARAGAVNARPLLDRAVEFLLARQLPSEHGRFGATGGDRDVTRAAWCYGGPGIAISLLCAGRDANEPEWEHHAIAIAKLAARRPVETCGVVDASLCHGAAGLGHIFHRFYRATGDVIFRTAAVDWFVRTLEMRRAGGIGGYQAWSCGEWVDSTSLLAGSAGIGLALLAAATDVDPAWDRLLLCSTAS